MWFNTNYEQNCSIYCILYPFTLLKGLQLVYHYSASMTLLELDQLAPGEVMISSKTRVRAVFSFIAVFVLSLSLFADTIRLKDGSIIKGTIIGFADGRFTIAVGEGTRRRELTLLSDEIASIEFEAIPATSARLSQPLPKIVPVSTKPSQTKTDNTGSVQTSPSTKSAPRV